MKNEISYNVSTYALCLAIHCELIIDVIAVLLGKDKHRQ